MKSIALWSRVAAVAMLFAALIAHPVRAQSPEEFYKGRILTSSEGTKAVTRVIIESGDSTGARWSTVGVSANVIDASYSALYDAIVYKLFRAGVKASV